MFDLVKRFLRDDRGTVTVEFVLIFPLLALWLGASFIFFDAFKTTSQAAKAAYTIADIVSRQPVIPAGYIDDLHTLQENLLPRSPNGKWLRLTSIEYVEDPDLDGDGEPDAKYHRVLWSRAKPLAVDSNGKSNEMTDAEIPTEILPQMSPNDTVVLVENFVPYTSIPIPLLSELSFTGLEWRNRIPIRPRYTSQVAMNGPSYSVPPIQVAAVPPPTQSDTLTGPITSVSSTSGQNSSPAPTQSRDTSSNSPSSKSSSAQNTPGSSSKSGNTSTASKSSNNSGGSTSSSSKKTDTSKSANTNKNSGNKSANNKNTNSKNNNSNKNAKNNNSKNNNKSAKNNNTKPKSNNNSKNNSSNNNKNNSNNKPGNGSSTPPKTDSSTKPPTQTTPKPKPEPTFAN